MMGRPTKYTDETPSKAWHYVKNYKEYGDVIPMVAGLAVALEVHKDTVYEWCKHEDKKDFSDAVRAIEDLQHKVLVNGSLSGEYVPMIAKLMLSTNHGYSEKQQVDQTVKGTHTVEHTASSVDKFADILKDYSEPKE